MNRDLCTHNVIAVYRDTEVAKGAVEELRERGFHDAELSVLGEPVEALAEVTYAPYPEEEPLGGDVVKHTLVGGAGGGAIGAVLGAVGTVAATAVPGVGLLAAPAALVGGIAGALAGSTVGSLVEGEAALRSTSGWAQTFQSIGESFRGGGVAIGIHTDDDERAELAERVVRSTNPTDVHRLNATGEPVV